MSLSVVQLFETIKSIMSMLIKVDTNAFVPLTNYIFIFVRLKGNKSNKILTLKMLMLKSFKSMLK